MEKLSPEQLDKVVESASKLFDEETRHLAAFALREMGKSLSAAQMANEIRKLLANDGSNDFLK